jgi:hypothetical protein
MLLDGALVPLKMVLLSIPAEPGPKNSISNSAGNPKVGPSLDVSIKEAVTLPVFRIGWIANPSLIVPPLIHFWTVSFTSTVTKRREAILSGAIIPILPVLILGTSASRVDSFHVPVTKCTLMPAPAVLTVGKNSLSLAQRTTASGGMSLRSKYRYDFRVASTMRPFALLVE